MHLHVISSTQRLELIRQGEEGLNITLYLDASQQAHDAWQEDHGSQVVALDEGTSAALLTLLREFVVNGRAEVLDDEAANAVQLVSGLPLEEQERLLPWAEHAVMQRPRLT